MTFGAVPKIAAAPQGALTESVLDNIAHGVELLFLLPIVEQRSLSKLRVVDAADAHAQQPHRRVPLGKPGAQPIGLSLPEHLRGV